VDFVASPREMTDTIWMADVATRSNPVLGAETIVLVEAGARHRIGPQTLVFLGTGTELTGRRDRTRLQVRLGLTHVY
jgi:hypothetical protein